MKATEQKKNRKRGRRRGVEGAEEVGRAGVRCQGWSAADEAGGGDEGIRD